MKNLTDALPAASPGRLPRGPAHRGECKGWGSSGALEHDLESLVHGPGDHLFELWGNALLWKGSCHAVSFGPSKPSSQTMLQVEKTAGACWVAGKQTSQSCSCSFPPDLLQGLHIFPGGAVVSPSQRWGTGLGVSGLTQPAKPCVHGGHLMVDLSSQRRWE